MTWQQTPDQIKPRAVRVLLTCKTCEQEFYAQQCLIDRDGKRLYCSMKCRDFKGENNPRYKHGEGIQRCKGCGKGFRIKPSLLKSGHGKKYCSPECFQSKHGKTEKKCPECGEIFICFMCHEVRAKFCSRSCASTNFYRKNNQLNKGVQRGKGGKRIDLENQYFRSSWEANYARYLNFLIRQKEIKKWEYEPETFEFVKIKKGTRFYTPDFKVFKDDDSFEFHEVKGWNDKKSQTRAKRMAKYFPAIKIIIIDKVWFRSAGRVIGKIIPHWEGGTA